MSLDSSYVLGIILDDRDTKISKAAFAIYVMDMKRDKLQYCFENSITV